MIIALFYEIYNSCKKCCDSIKNSYKLFNHTVYVLYQSNRTEEEYVI